MTSRHTAAIASYAQPAAPDMESVFRAHYPRITNLIARITRDPSRAEELAVEVFLRWPPPDTRDDGAIAAWLTHVAVRIALDEARRKKSWGRLAQFVATFRSQPDPQQIYEEHDQSRTVIGVLSRLKPRDAELLTLRAEGFSYEELAAALSLNLNSIGTLVSRAQAAFRKEYVKRYGTANLL